VILQWLKTPQDGDLTVDGLPELWFELDATLRPWPAGRATVRCSGAGLAARAPKILAIRALGGFVARRSLVAPVLGNVPAGELVLRDVALADTKGKVVDEDFVYLDVRAQAPLDRAAAKAAWTPAGAPSAAFLSRLEVATWGPDRIPRAQIFRIGEANGVIAASLDLATALGRATKQWIGARRQNPNAPQYPGFSNHPDETPAVGQPRAAAAAAEDAYWRLARGAGGPKDRATACTSPIWAYWLALTVDGEPRDDTTKAVLTHPTYALRYAVELVRAPSPAFERAVAADWWAAGVYATVLAKEVAKVFEATLVESGWALEAERERIEELARFIGGAPPRPPPTVRVAEGITLRPAVAADAPRLLAIEKACFKRRPYGTKAFREALAEGELVWVSVDDAGVVVGLSVSSRDRLHLLAVDPTHARQGHARALLERVVADARKHRTAAIDVTTRASNAAAQKLFRSVGFRVVHRRSRYPDDEVAVAMRLSL
jgi:ribosomal-protein-alanine N-acetyltransferase